MSDNTDWEAYKKFVVPNKKSKLFEKQIENPRIIKNSESSNNKILNNQNFLSNLSNSQYNTSIANKKIQRKFKSETSIDLHYITGDLNNILETFCSKCILYGMHYVTIITGKGKGILRNSVILWLKSNNQFVIEYFEIKDIRNECGSLGIHLRSLNKLKNIYR